MRAQRSLRFNSAQRTGRKGLSVLLFFVLAASLSLPGCFGIPAEPQVAATVGDQKIYESDVTEYIEGFRTQTSDYEDDEEWAAFLRDNGYTAETIRTFILDTVFIPKAIIAQECAARGISLSDSELDSVIEREKEFYESRYGADSWDSVLSSYGYDGQSWRENEESRLLEEQLAREVAKVDGATPAQVQKQANEDVYKYNGKHSYYLRFSSEEQAAEAAGRIRRMTSKKLKLAKLKKRFGMVDAGWNSIEDDRNAMGAEYINALNDLEKGQVSDPLQQGEYWILVFCDEVFNLEKGSGDVDLDLLPDAILAQVRNDALSAASERKFSRWMKRRKKKLKVVYAPMPEGLSYDVNVALKDGKDA